MNVTIDVNKLCGKNKVSREDGRVLYEKISEELETNLKATIDLGNILVASVSFLDEAFGTLTKSIPQSELLNRVAIINMLEFDKILLNDILKSRYRQREFEAIRIPG